MSRAVTTRVRCARCPIAGGRSGQTLIALQS
jgi:hypothetical protein